MSSQNGRTQRVAEQIKRELGMLVQRELRDPRLGWVNITAVRVTADLSHANVFFTVIGENTDVEASLQTLQRSAGFLRSKISKILKARTTPQLHFQHDESVERGSYMESLLDSLAEEDQKKFGNTAEKSSEAGSSL